MADPKMRTLDVPEGKLDRMSKLFDCLPDSDEGMEQMVARLKEVKASLPTVEEIKKAKAHLNKYGADLKVTGDEFKKLLEDGKAKFQALSDATYEVVDKEWTWQRIVWAIASGLGGGALAWWLNEKQPMLNHMGAGVSMGRGLEFLGVPKEHSMFIGGAGGSLFSQWAGGKNGAMPIASIAMAGYAYGEAIFSTGEAIAETAEGWTEIFMAEPKAETKKGKKGKKEAA